MRSCWSRACGLGSSVKPLERTAVFFNIDKIRLIADQIRNQPWNLTRKIRAVYCGNCGKDQEQFPLFFRDIPDMPYRYMGSRVCTVCGFSPGQNPGVKDKALRRAVLEADHHECVYCGTTERLTIDHIVPHVHGGEATFENLLTSCKTCNSNRRIGRTPVLRFGRFRRSA